MNPQALKILLCCWLVAITLVVAGSTDPVAAARFQDAPVVKTVMVFSRGGDAIDHARAPVEPGIFQPTYQIQLLRPGLGKAILFFRLPDNRSATLASRCDGIVPRQFISYSSFLVEKTRASRAPPLFPAA